MGDASATLHQVACYGNLQARANSDVLEAARILQGLNAPLREDIRWHALLWCAHRHWAVVLKPHLPKATRDSLLRVDADILRAGAMESGPVVSVPPERLYIVFELLVANRNRDFFPRLSIFPDFDERRGNVYDLGLCGPWAIEEISEMAISVISRYRAYGLIGCNCQHYVLDLFQELGVETPTKMTDDQRAEEAAARGIQAYSVVVGVAKGASAAVGVAATGIGCVSVAGAVLLSAHVVAGCAVGFVGGIALQTGYQWVCRQHRREESAQHVEAGGDTTCPAGSTAQSGLQEERLLSDWGQLT